MTKNKLMQYIGKKVTIFFINGERMIYGKLGYVDEFSSKHDFRKLDYFYINQTSFKASHVRAVIEDGIIFSDYPDMQHQYDNMTGSMNLY